jgi:hypothetical protein
MFFSVTLWAAALNLVLLAMALSWTPAFWTQASHWLSALPWRTFGTESAGLLQMQAVDAGVLWALWITFSGVVLLGGGVCYWILKRHVLEPAVAALPTPEVADMFGQLSSSLSGLHGFGDLHDAPAKPAGPVGPVPTLQVRAPQEATPVAIAANLQGIDPELGSSFDAVLRELGQPSGKS